MNSSIDPLFVEMLYIPSTTEHEAGPPFPETQQRSSSGSSKLLEERCACLHLVQGDLDTHRLSLFFPTLTAWRSHLCCSWDCSVCCCKPDRITAADMNKYSDNQMVRILTEPLQACLNKTMRCFQIYVNSAHFSVFSKTNQAGEQKENKYLFC